MTFFRPLNRSDVLSTSINLFPEPSKAYVSDVRDLNVTRHEIVVEDSSRSKKIFTTLFVPSSRTGNLKLPVLLFSHGVLSDCNSYVFLGLKLASHGFAVIFPTHADSLYLMGFASISKHGGMEALVHKHISDSKLWVDRCKDMHYLIDNLEHIVGKQVPSLVGAFNLSRVGVFGHSYGAQTCMALSGTVLTTAGIVLFVVFCFVFSF